MNIVAKNGWIGALAATLGVAALAGAGAAVASPSVEAIPATRWRAPRAGQPKSSRKPWSGEHLPTAKSGA